MLRVGIIGFGRIGAEHQLWMAQSCHARAVAVADPTPARRSLAQSRGMLVHESLDALLQDDSIDAVLISTPTAMHHQHAASALAAGKHVMVEKPISLTLAEAQDLLARARLANKTLSVFHNRRWDLDYLTLKNAIDAGTFGTLINIESRIGQWASCVGPAAREWHPNWRNEACYGGGALYDWGSHFLDQLWRLFHPARPTRVFAQLRHHVWSRDCDDFARVSIDFDNDAVGIVEINTTTTRPLPRWHVDGTAGSADSRYSLTFDLATWSEFHFTPAGGVEPQMLPVAPPGPSEAQIWDRFALATRGESLPAVTADSVLPTMALLDAARESSITESAVALPADLQWIL